MKTIKKHISEEKLIKKQNECDGMSMGGFGGDIASPSDSSPGDITSSDQNGITTADIFGHCDHKKDGFFGPGCFHLPKPLFRRVLSRFDIDRKKKKKNKNKRKEKYIKVLDITESEGFGDFRDKVNSIINKLLPEVKNDISSIDEFDIKYDPEYKFDDYKEDWVSALSKDADSILNLIIGINIPVLYKYLLDNDAEDDIEELECQLKAYVYHEIGHALLQYFCDKETYDFELTDNDEETVVEEYSNYKLKEYTNQKNSKLQNFIDEIFSKED